MKYLILAVVVVVVAEAAHVLSPERRQSDQFVAFSAGLTKTVNVSDHSDIVFDKVFTNYGNGYDNTTGVFTCPRAGIYNIMYHALTETQGTFRVDLFKNGQYVVTGYAHNAADYAAASNSAVLQLNQGDKVHLEAIGVDNLYGMTDEIYGTFSGFLLVNNGV